MRNPATGRSKRVGPLLQGRYKAKLMDGDSYSLQLLRYIHLNPVKTELNAEPEGRRGVKLCGLRGKSEEG